MKICLLCMGKTDESIIRKGVEKYAIRIRRYAPFEIHEIPAPKNVASFPVREVLAREGELILKQIRSGDFTVLLDEHGKQCSSRELSGFLNQWFLTGKRTLVFLIGGAFGVDKPVRDRADTILSLSNLTFPHQLVRLIFTEQLYRALTLLRNEPYHH